MIRLGIYALIAVSILSMTFGLGHRIGYKSGAEHITAQYAGQAEQDRDAANLKLQTQTMEDQKAYKELAERESANRQLVAAAMKENAKLSAQLFAAEQSLKSIRKDPHVAATLDTAYPDAVHGLRDPLKDEDPGPDHR